MFKDLGYKDKMKGEVEVNNAIMSTMVFEPEILEPLYAKKVPVILNYIILLIFRSHCLLKEIKLKKDLK